MRGLLASVAALLLLAGCSRAEPTVPAAWNGLEQIATRPEATIDPADAPAPPRGFDRADVDELATQLAAAASSLADDEAATVATHQASVDTTFPEVPLPARIRFAALMDETSRATRDMPMAWTLVDEFEPRARPVGRARVVKTAWEVEAERGVLTVSLQFVRAHHTRGGLPMLVDRTLSLSSARWPGDSRTQYSIGLGARVAGIDRCHLVATGRFRPERDPDQLRLDARSMRRSVGSSGVTPESGTAFDAGCPRD